MSDSPLGFRLLTHFQTGKLEALRLLDEESQVFKIETF